MEAMRKAISLPPLAGEGCGALASASELRRSWMRGSAPTGARSTERNISDRDGPRPTEELSLSDQLNPDDAVFSAPRCAARAAPPLIQLRLSSAHASLSLRILPPQGGKGFLLWPAVRRMGAPNQGDRMTDLYRLTAFECVRRLRAGDLSPLDLIDAVERRAAQVNGAVNALVTPCYDRARDHARRLMALPPAERGLLAGLPVAIKDLNDVAGVRTTYGSPIFADNVPKVSDIMVQTIESNGGIVVGMTNTPEFGAGANTFNAVFGETRNPWNPALNAAGSSGGSAAALATGIVALASGSDLGGSLRTPASFCSVVGFRPNPGRVANGPGEQRFNDLSVEGPMARNVLAAAQRKRRPKRAALAIDLGGATPVDQPTRAIVRAAADKLANAGIEIVEASPDFSGAMEAFHVLRGLGYVANMRALLERHRDQLKPDVIWNVEAGMALTAEDRKSVV